MKSTLFALIFLCTFLSFFPPSDTHAEIAAPPDLTGTPWEGMTVPPDTKLIETKDRKGNTIRRLEFSAGVTYTHRRGSGYASSDHTGKGAVTCIEGILVEIKTIIDRCGVADTGRGNAEEAYFWLHLHEKTHGGKTTETTKTLEKARTALTKDKIEKLDARIAIWKSRPTGIGAIEPKLTQEQVETARDRAQAGDPEAQYILSITGKFTTGPEGPLSMEDQLSWMLKAAEQGHMIAQFSLASHYEGGFGTKPDFNQSIKWYTLAAEQGYAPAQLKTGLMHAKGLGKMSMDEFKNQIDAALDRIATFNAANSPRSLTKEEAVIRQRNHTLPYGCLGDGSTLSNPLRSKSPDEFRRWIDDVLSIPRPPAIEPCL